MESLIRRLKLSYTLTNVQATTRFIRHYSIAGNIYQSINLVHCLPGLRLFYYLICVCNYHWFIIILVKIFIAFFLSVCYCLLQFETQNFPKIELITQDILDTDPSFTLSHVERTAN